ncbi:MAG: transcriptional regulator GlxA family with amidase domain [Candidatus Endobugula sp.]|jgi:transcriptional regulator GlxA family with amidase domain
MKKLLPFFVFTAFILMVGQAHAAKKTIGIIVFDGVLTSDVIGPAEVFGAATRLSWFTDYDVQMINVNTQKTIITEEGIKINVDTNITEEQKLTVLLLPSAYDMKSLLNNEVLINFIQTQAKHVVWLGSNCSGALLLAESGLLNGKQATTWAGGELEFQKAYPKVRVKKDSNYVVDGNVITSNGGIVSYMAALKMLALMSSEKLAQEVSDALQISRLVKR